jgi:hypothetical protein
LEYVENFRNKIEKILNTDSYYKRSIMASIISSNTIYESCNYYIMYRINKSNWTCILDKPFVLNSYEGKLYGQFLSSSWFKKQIQSDDIIDLLIIRLPRRDSAIYPNEQITSDIIIKRITEFDNHNQNTSYINYEMLDFVVIHKYYRSDSTKYICNNLKEKLKDNEKRDAIRDYELFGTPIFSSIDITFEIVDDKDDNNNLVNLNTVNLNTVNLNTVNLNTVNLNTVNLNTANDIMNIPQLIRNDGSWNTHRNSYSQANEKYFITCPQFTLNIR